MDRSICKFLELRHASRTSLLPMHPFTQEECKGAAGVAYLFLMSSHALTLMTGVLGIVSLKELGPTGTWRNSELSAQVGALSKLTADVAQAAECALEHALFMLTHQQTTLSPAEARGVGEIRASGEVYVTLLKSVALETRLAAIQQNLSVTVQRSPMHAAVESIPGTEEVGGAIRQLTEQVMELQLRLEMYEARTSS